MVQSIHTFGQWCANTEVRPSEKLRGLFTLVMVIYAGAATTYGSMHYFAIVGEASLRSVDHGIGPILAFMLDPGVLITLLCLAIFVRYFITLAGYTKQKQEFGDEMPLEYAAYQLTNLVMIVFAATVVMIPALILAGVFGWDMDQAQSWLFNMEAYLKALPEKLDQIPTLIHFSPFIAYFSSRIVFGFIAYWWHRLCHEWRPLWLLVHRPHHTPERISEMTSIVADDVGIGFILKKFAMPFLYGMFAKLFSHDSTSIVEIVLIVTLIELIYNVALGAIGHTLTMYQWAVNNRWVKWGFFVTAGGPFHLMHHSSKQEHQVVNLGFCPLYFWDILFGTFVWPSKETPKTGLTNNPEVHLNPLRLAFGGFAEMYMEFKHNKSWKDRFLILFGSSQYNPPIRFHYHKKVKAVA